MEHGTPSASKASDQGYPRAFGRYRLIAPIAMGGMAEVFLAEMLGPLGFRRRVAIKRILPHLAQNREFVRAFVDEARVGGLLVHPNIVQILDFSFVDKVPYLAMEFVDGGHLGHVLDRMRRKHARMPAPVIVALLSQVGRGLEWAHQARDVDDTLINLIHRDLKPSNLLFGFDGHIKIADFGIAKASSNLTQTQPSMVKGSMPYMSPEQAMGVSPLTQSSDLFSLGAVAFECLTGERLYPPTTNAMVLLGLVARGPSSERLALLEHLPAGYEAIAPAVKRLLAARPEDRFRDAGAFVSALERSEVIPASQEELAAFARRWLSREEATTSRQLVVPSPPRRAQPKDLPSSDSKSEEIRPTRPWPSEPPTSGQPNETSMATPTSLPPRQHIVGVDERKSTDTGPTVPTHPELSVQKERPDARPSPAVDQPGRNLRFAWSRQLTFATALSVVLLAGAGITWHWTAESPPPIITPLKDPAAHAWLYVVSDRPEGRVSINGADAGPMPCQVGLSSTDQEIHVRLVLPDGSSKRWQGRVANGEHRVIDFRGNGPPAAWTLQVVPWAQETTTGNE